MTPIVFVRAEKFKIMKDRKPKALLRFVLLSFTYIACVSMGLYYWKRNATLLNLFLFSILGLSGLIFLMWSVSSNYIGLISNNSQLKEQLKTTTLPLTTINYFIVFFDCRLVGDDLILARNAILKGSHKSSIWV